MNVEGKRSVKRQTYALKPATCNKACLLFSSNPRMTSRSLSTQTTSSSPLTGKGKIHFRRVCSMTSLIDAKQASTRRRTVREQVERREAT